jgi:hypothetical protein
MPATRGGGLLAPAPLPPPHPAHKETKAAAKAPPIARVFQRFEIAIGIQYTLLSV